MRDAGPAGGKVAKRSGGGKSAPRTRAPGRGALTGARPRPPPTALLTFSDVLLDGRKMRSRPRPVKNLCTEIGQRAVEAAVKRPRGPSSPGVEEECRERDSNPHGLTPERF